MPVPAQVAHARWQGSHVLLCPL
uniref:Uncharacterized protein n=1 Tax=Anguilla anguilla TaxID=7936 RepID=A0A0E9RVM0_ANGAN